MVFLQVLPLRVRVDLEVMLTKEHFTFPKVLELEPHYQMQFSVTFREVVGGEGESCPSAEMQSVFSTAPADWFLWGFIPRISLEDARYTLK